jgi:hypothetical protein
MVMPPGPGFPDSSTLRTDCVPPFTEFGIASTVFTVIGCRETLANFTNTPERAVIVAREAVFTSLTLIVKFAIKLPEGTVTDAGTSTLGLFDSSEIRDPLAGAVPVNSTVASTVPSPENTEKEVLMAFSAAGFMLSFAANFVLSTRAETATVTGSDGDFATTSNSTRTLPGVIDTSDGTVMSWEEVDSLKVIPDAGAGEGILITPTLFSPAFTMVGLILNVGNGSAPTFRIASDPLPPARADTTVEYANELTFVAMGKERDV